MTPVELKYALSRKVEVIGAICKVCEQTTPNYVFLVRIYDSFAIFAPCSGMSPVSSDRDV